MENNFRRFEIELFQNEVIQFIFLQLVIEFCESLKLRNLITLIFITIDERKLDARSMEFLYVYLICKEIPVFLHIQFDV